MLDSLFNKVVGLRAEIWAEFPPKFAKFLRTPVSSCNFIYNDTANEV